MPVAVKVVVFLFNGRDARCPSKPPASTLSSSISPTQPSFTSKLISGPGARARHLMLSRRALGEILLVTRTADAPRETTRARFQSGSKQVGSSVVGNAADDDSRVTRPRRRCSVRSRREPAPSARRGRKERLPATTSSSRILLAYSGRFASAAADAAMVDKLRTITAVIQVRYSILL